MDGRIRALARTTMVAGALVLGGMTVVSSARAQDSTAQQPGRHRGGHGGRQARLLKGIQLTAQQQQQVQAIRDKYRGQMQQLRSQSGDAKPDSATRAQFRQQMEQQLGEIRNVLTPDQQKTFDQNVAQMRERRANRERRHHQDSSGA